MVKCRPSIERAFTVPAWRLRARAGRVGRAGLTMVQARGADREMVGRAMTWRGQDGEAGEDSPRTRKGRR